MPSKVALETSLCDNDNGDGINRLLRVRLLNLEVTPVTRISNSAVLEAIVTKKKKSADKSRESKKFSKSSAAFILCIHTPLIWQGSAIVKGNAGMEKRCYTE